MPSSGERLTDIILSNRMTKKDFATALGYNPSYITQICRDTKPPSLQFAKKVEVVFGVPSEWLIHGKQRHGSASGAKDVIMSRISHMHSDEELNAVLAFINCLDELPKQGGVAPPVTISPPVKRPAVRPKERPAMYTVPIKGEVAGGAPIYAYETYEETVKAPIRADSALYLKGKSMEPDYPDGSIILIKENTYISNGDVVVALIMQEADVAEATCKIFKRNNKIVSLIPINPDYETQNYDISDGYEIKIFGKVVGKVTAD